MPREGVTRIRLPCQPQILLRVLTPTPLVHGRDMESVEVVGWDLALCTAVFSAAAGIIAPRLSGAVTIDDAMDAIGPEGLRSVAVRLVSNVLSGEEEAIHNGQLISLWRRSLFVATLARALAILAEYREPEEAYLAGLMHNVGQFILAARSPKQYADVLAATPNRERLRQLERSHFEQDYYAVGASLIAEWRLDTFLEDAIRYHGEPASELGAAHSLVKLVHLAATLSPVNSEAGQNGMASASAWFQLSAHEVGEQIAQAGSRVEALERELGISPDIKAQGYARRLLSDRICNVALMDGASQALRRAPTRESAIAAVQHGARLLLDAPVARLLFLDKDSGRLRGADGDQPEPLWQQLDIPATADGGIVGQTLMEHTPLSSFDDASPELKVVDRQILRLLKQPGMVCVPLGSADQPIGVLVLGLGDVQTSVASDRLTLLQNFAVRATGMLPEPQSVSAAPRQDQSQLSHKVRQYVHEARNPLTALKNYVQVLAVKHPDSPWVHEDMPVLNEEIDRAEAILSRLAALTSPDGEAREAGTPVSMDVNKVIEDLLRVHSRSVLEPRGIEVKLDLDGNVPVLTLDQNAFKQILSNLVSNAGDTMDKGGELTISTRDAITDDQGVYVEVSVEDNGPGLPGTVLNQLYKPVRSAKGGSHEGLGLSIVKELMDEMGGHIQCQSEPGKGTRFRLFFPRLLD